MNKELQHQKKMAEQAHMMAAQRVLDEKAKRRQRIQRSPVVYSCEVERADNETYYLITFNQKRIPRGFFSDYGLKFESARSITAKSLRGRAFRLKWIYAVATSSEGGQ